MELYFDVLGARLVSGSQGKFTTHSFYMQMDDSEVISFLLQTEIIPLCLRIMDNGSELSKTVATFIIQKILLDDMGLNYICATYERFSTVSSVLRYVQYSKISSLVFWRAFNT